MNLNIISKYFIFCRKRAGCDSVVQASPVDRALLFGHHSLEVRELEEAVVEVVQVENTHQQEGSRDENPGEQLGHRELLQAQVLQAA